MEAELVAVDGEAQVRLDLPAAAHLLAHGHVIELERIAPCRLGRVERRVDRLQELLGLGAVVRSTGDAHAGADVDAVAVDFVGRAEDLVEAACNDLELPAGAQRLDHHRELVAAEARDHVLRPERFAQALGYRLQEGVAGGVAERIVDVLELVEVDPDEAETRRLGSRVERRLDRGDAAVETRAQLSAVGETREAVLGSEPDDLFLRAPPRGDVGEGPDKSSAVERLGADFEHRPVRAHALEDMIGRHVGGWGNEVDGVHPGRQGDAIEFAALVQVLQELGERCRPVDEFVGQVQKLGRATVEDLDAPLAVDEQDAVRDVLEREAQPFRVPRRAAAAAQQRIAGELQPCLVQGAEMAEAQEHEGEDGADGGVTHERVRAVRQHLLLRHADGHEHRMSAHLAEGDEAHVAVGGARRHEDAVGRPLALVHELRADEVLAERELGRPACRPHDAVMSDEGDRARGP